MLYVIGLCVSKERLRLVLHGVQDGEGLHGPWALQESPVRLRLSFVYTNLDRLMIRSLDNLMI